MTKFTVAIQSEADGTTARTTADVDDALDWYTNACTEVMDAEADLQFASLSVDGQVWAMIREHGLSPQGGEAEVIDLPGRRRA